MHIELTVYPFFEPKQSLSLQNLRTVYENNCILFNAKNKSHKLKFIEHQSNSVSEYSNPETISINKLTKGNDNYRLGFDEMYGWITLAKFFVYKGMVEPYELIENSGTILIDLTTEQ
jgi:hypothetical protein